MTTVIYEELWNQSIDRWRSRGLAGWRDGDQGELHVLEGGV